MSKSEYIIAHAAVANGDFGAVRMKLEDAVNAAIEQDYTPSGDVTMLYTPAGALVACQPMTLCGVLESAEGLRMDAAWPDAQETWPVAQPQLAASPDLRPGMQWVADKLAAMLALGTHQVRVYNMMQAINDAIAAEGEE